ncbi:MAG TPA: EAL domain-containing protein [Thermoleophilaceae bacterium]|nr:EAL domain-containing protein [Thermoleophilaceae bacterium]
MVATILYSLVAGVLILALAHAGDRNVHEDAVDEAKSKLAVLSVLGLPELDDAFRRLEANGEVLRVWRADGLLRYRSRAGRGIPAAPSHDRARLGEPWWIERDAAPDRRAGLVIYMPVMGRNGLERIIELDESLEPVHAAAGAERRQVALLYGGAALLLWVGVLPLMLRLSRRLRETRTPQRDRRLLRRFARALADGELELHYQPKLDLVSGRVDSVEALVRWRRDGHLVAPGDFLPVVERSPLIERLTAHVVDAGVAQVRAWLDEGLRIGVAVNLAPVNLDDPGLVAEVDASLRRWDVEPGLLTLEVTETAVLEDEASAGATLDGLAALGVRLSVDDFGTGYSSLARVTRYPFSELKIDRLFVAELTTQKRPIVATVIRLAKTLQLDIVAEGVEDEATLNALRGLGCDVVQGFFVGRPSPADELPEVFARIPDLAKKADSVRGLLDEVRVALSLDAAFVAEFVGDDEVFRWTSGDRDRFALYEGANQELCESYCGRVVSGVFPNLIADAQHDPLTRDLPVTELRGIGAYIGVPINRPDGTLYGTLCGLSNGPRPDLTGEQVDALARFGERISPLLESAHLSISAR